MSWLRSLFPMLALGAGRVRRAIARTPRQEIAQLREGHWQKVHGSVLTLGGMVGASLIESRPCLCSRTIVDVAFYGDAAWLHLIDHFQSVPFRLRDETGVIRVDSNHLRLIGPVDADSFDSPDSHDHESLERILAESHFGFRGWENPSIFLDGDGHRRGLRVRETLVAEGDQVELCGIARREAAIEASRESYDYRSTPTELVFRGSRRRPVLVARQAAPAP
ncbi:MAG: hypothetical protein KJO07_14865 [Deltaproteobacteria bacterium]|nr:hypothetical protein [Deltaproteobacteria bacterium]